MLKRVLKRLIRQPISALAVILFTGVLSVVLCHLHMAEEEEIRSFEETYRSVPVYVQVTNLDGSELGRADRIEGWLGDLFFADSKITPHFADLITDLQLRMSHPGVLGDDLEDELAPVENMIGITSLQVAQELTAEHGGSIQWYSGYDESIFASDAFVCIVPEDYESDEEIQLTFRYVNREQKIDKQYTCTFQIAGRFSDQGNFNFYCPYSALAQIYLKLGEPKQMEHISATLKDNADLPLLRETADYWFARPNPLGELTEWGKFGYDYYLYALDINDTLLNTLETNMKNSIRVNQLASMVVFLLSAGAGFLTGFLVIRSRKREIALMRTLGTSNPIVCMELEMEQILCIVAGVTIGGSYSLWEPIAQLCLFAGIYTAGLSVALFIFISTNLLATIKEDE